MSVAGFYSGFQTVNSADPGFWVPTIMSLVCGVGGFILCRFRRVFLILMLPSAWVCMIWTGSVIYDVTGELIIHQLGYGFYAGMKVAVALAWILPIGGTALPRRRTTLR